LQTGLQFYKPYFLVDLIKWVSNVRQPVRTSVRPQKVSSHIFRLTLHASVRPSTKRFLNKGQYLQLIAARFLIFVLVFVPRNFEVGSK